VKNLFLAITALISILCTEKAWSGACVAGIDCYCDKVKNPTSPLYDSKLMMCEDFEAQTLNENVKFGNTSGPNYGPPYDPTGFANAGWRGFNGYWNRTYGNSGEGCGWQFGQPATPKVGAPCSGVCATNPSWHVTDLWQANSFACMFIWKQGEHNAEVTSLTAPTNTSSGGSGVFDGIQSMAHRNPAGKSSGILGGKHFGSSKFNFGITQAIAYPTNIASSGLLNGPLKHEEWGDHGDGILLFHNQNGLTKTFPFNQMFTFGLNSSYPVSTCLAKVAAANVRKGILSCNGSGLLWEADSSYEQSRDWPFGKWGCVRGQFTNLGTTNMGIKIWLNDQVIVDFDGFDDTGLYIHKGYSFVTWDNFANTNQGGDYTPSTQTSYRWQDNVHIREGAPVSCSQIGFGGVSSTPSTTPTKPSAPRNLRIM
jgi:hypothetical protein